MHSRPCYSHVRLLVNPAHHALVLNFHQPAHNLARLLEEAPWDVEQILYAFDRIPRSLVGYEDIARVHLAVSGTLLETLSDPDFQARVYGWVDCGTLLWRLQDRRSFEMLATGYYHPVLPLLSNADREEHVMRWRGIARHLFWREDFQGIWPPELGFCMEMIPLLVRLGFRYVIVDSEHVRAITPMRWEEIRYRPHVARFEGHEIIVVVRDRDLSNAQLSGMDYGWFVTEVQARTQHCDAPALVTTCTDGDNGGWFRNVQPRSNFWGAFYQPMLDDVRNGTASVLPTFIHDYLDRFGASGEVWVHTAAWNTGDHSGLGFVQWTGSTAQKEALSRVRLTSDRIHRTRWQVGERHLDDPSIHHALESAMWRCLRAQTSCNFYWGEAWVGRCHADLDEAWKHLHAAEAAIPQA